MKIVFFGNSNFAVVSLRAMVDAGYDVVGVVTQEKKGYFYSGVNMSPVKKYALSKNISILSSRKNLRNKIQQLKEWKADLFVVAAHEQTLTKEMLYIPVSGCINLHPSLLPKYRGESPIQCTICNGDKETGITIIKMNERMDAGDIITQESISITKDETIKSLSHKLSILGAGLLLETLPMLEFDFFISCKQNEKKATYTKVQNKTQKFYFKMKEKILEFYSA